MYAKKNSGKKILVTLLAVVMLLGATIGGTIAWLMDDDDAVVNTFSTSDITVQLEESDNLNLTMIPGFEITKDPKAWIKEGSEDAYLFVKIEESENFEDFMTYKIADGWSSLANVDGVYYREIIKATDTDEENNINEQYPILKDNKVTVLETVTKEMMSADDFEEPTLTFTAYAHQLYKSEGVKIDVATAWTNLNPPAEQG